MIRRLLILVHRYGGLAMALFLIAVGVTGSLLAFDQDLERFINPQLFAARPTPQSRHLDVATLADRAHAAEPKAQIAYFLVSTDQAHFMVVPRIDPSTGKACAIDFDELFLDPWSGKELGRRRNGDLSQGRLNLMPFVYAIHESLAMGSAGYWALGVVALAWTLDCFVGFYLTLPAGTGRFLSRWVLAWKVKAPASAVRRNFDLHRAGGLWLWPLLLVFGWSSVMFNLSPVYTWTMGKVFRGLEDTSIHTLHPTHVSPMPRLGWHEALARAEQLMAEVARRGHFVAPEAIGMGYMPEVGAYAFAFRSSVNISDSGWGWTGWGTGLWVDGDTGELQMVYLARGQDNGLTVQNWLRALHLADWHDSLAYRSLVCALGLVIAVLSVTGVYIWFKKLQARKKRGRPALRRSRTSSLAPPG